MKRLVFAIMLFTVLFVAGQAVATGKVIVADEDTVISKDLEDIEVEIDIEAIVDEALEGIDKDIPREVVIKAVRKRLNEELPRSERMERRAKTQWADHDFDYKRNQPHGVYMPWGHHNSAIEMDKPWEFAFIGMFMAFVWRLIVLIMWIISLFVVGRGFSKIAGRRKE